MSDPSTWPSASFGGADHWPRLSETLPHREPGRCAACGEPEANSPPLPPSHSVWREHDRFDKPEARFVELCRACSDKLIDPHPRLYARLNGWAPAAGAMPLCLDCRHRDGTRCMSPEAKANGGEGITLIGPKPADVHFLRRGKGQRSGWEKVYRGPVKECSGFDPIAKGQGSGVDGGPTDPL